jgi:ABC-type nitrate/sulfonate/bicarbonate transport system permease component
MTKRYVLQRLGIVLAQVLAVALFLFLWERGSDHGVIDPVFFSRPSAMWHQIRAWSSEGTLWGNIKTTLNVFLVGYALGTGFGIVLGVIIGTVRWVREILEPFLAFFNAMPRLVLLPLLIVWFGFGLTPKIILVVAVILFIVALNVAAGVGEVRADVLNNAKLMGAGPMQLVRHVYVPSIGLWVLSTARLTVGYAFNATIAAEFIGANRGLGFLLTLGQNSTNANQVWGALAVTVVIAIIIDTVLAAVETRATRWMPATK